MSDSPENIENLINQPIVDMVNKHILSKGSTQDYTRLKEVLQFMQTEFKRLSDERLQKQQDAMDQPKKDAVDTQPQSSTTRKRLVWPQKKTSQDEPPRKQTSEDVTR